MKRVIAAISDLHLFSRYALMPPSIMTSQGQEIHASPEQIQIWDHFLNFVKVCKRDSVDTVLVVGDLLHGQNFIERGTLLISPDLDEQVDLGTQVLDLLVNPKDAPKRKLIMFGGSGYHRSTKGHNPEKDVCDRLGGVWRGAIANLKFAPSEKVFNIQHGESAAYVYREMLMGRELMFTKLAEATGKVPHIDVFVRGHWHNFIYIHEKDVHMIQLPAWMAYEPSKPYLKSYGKMQPDIGGCIFYIDDHDRLRVWHFTMDEIPHFDDKVQEA
ncbi:MAG: hypothetical protein QMD92_00120 [bacterium]|nr:hypothetical protein [bacterium]